MFRLCDHPQGAYFAPVKLYPQPPVQVIISVQLLPSNVARSATLDGSRCTGGCGYSFQYYS